jgi:hypothetical protein
VHRRGPAAAALRRTCRSFARCASSYVPNLLRTGYCIFAHLKPAALVLPLFMQSGEHR